MLVEFTPFEIESEEWRPVVGYEGWYEVSSLGRVRRSATYKILKPRDGGNRPYLRVVLYRNGHQRYTIHRLVAAAFLPVPAPERNQINHKDGCPTNNYPENLEWVTAKENIAHAHETGLKPLPTWANVDRDGTRNGRALLTEAQVIEIRNRYLPYVVTCKDLAREYGVNASTIFEVVSGKHWKSIPFPENDAYSTRRRAPKLTQEAVEQIRAIYAAGGVNRCQLGRQFGVSGTHIGRVIKGESWPT